MGDGKSGITFPKMQERIADVGAGVTPTYHASESVEEAKAVVEQCMSATDELRRMLDERGVRWRNNDTAKWRNPPHERSTAFHDENGKEVTVTQALSGRLAMTGRSGLTPEQAVEATLGRKRDERLAARMTDVMMRVERALGVDHGGAEVLSAEVAPLLREALEIIDTAAATGRGECRARQDWDNDETLHINLCKLPEHIDVTLPDPRGREVYSAKVHRFEPERGTCHAEEVYLDSHSDLTATVCSACRVAVDDLEDCNYCPNCGARVV